MFLEYKALWSQKAKGIKVDFSSCDLKTKHFEYCLFHSEPVIHLTLLKLRPFYVFFCFFSVAVGLLVVTSVFLVQQNVSGPTGMLSGEDDHASVAVLLPRVVKINVSLCKKTVHALIDYWWNVCLRYFSNVRVLPLCSCYAKICNLRKKRNILLTLLLLLLLWAKSGINSQKDINSRENVLHQSFWLH